MPVLVKSTASDSIDFASLLCSRLCHDLLSPVGALNNGIELLADETDPRMREQCLTLLADSARTTAGKLKFFRLAFGAGGGYGEAIPVHEIRSAVEGMFPPGGKISLDWMIAGDSLSKPAAKLLLNLVLLTGEALPRGGVIAIGAEQQGGSTEIAVRGEGTRITFDPAIRAGLEGHGDLTTRTAAAVMIRTVATEAGGELMISGADEPHLLFGARLPT
ncbi:MULTISPECIES: histidine phosphotransferase family protein [unclassified Sphingobium]|uniref:histidine phosphotransferase family protein n=1 Tax=unclassified Sphingobium TaxID=2611147 RepID=UPI0022254A0E|nr:MULTISPECIES: histidine phosphotransferase family protein [unclassified Sphingobium]